MAKFKPADGQKAYFVSGEIDMPSCLIVEEFEQEGKFLASEAKFGENLYGTRLEAQAALKRVKAALKG